MIRSVLSRSIRVILGLAAMQASAFAACGLPQPRLVCQEYFAKPAVVVGRLTRIRIVGRGPNEVKGRYYYFEIVERLKGKTLQRFQVYESNDSGRAAFEWKRGEKYLLFISYAQGDRAWELDGCGNSAPLASASKVLREIGRIRSGRSREMIQGAIASEESLPRSSIKIEGEGGTYTTLTDKRNEFSIRVPIGVYVVTAEHAGWEFAVDEFSYDDAKKVTIQPGSCAQIQFTATQTPPPH